MRIIRLHLVPRITRFPLMKLSTYVRVFQLMYVLVGKICVNRNISTVQYLYSPTYAILARHGFIRGTKIGEQGCQKYLKKVPFKTILPRLSSRDFIHWIVPDRWFSQLGFLTLCYLFLLKSVGSCGSSMLYVINEGVSIGTVCKSLSASYLCLPQILGPRQHSLFILEPKYFEGRF